MVVFVSHSAPASSIEAISDMGSMVGSTLLTKIVSVADAMETTPTRVTMVHVVNVETRMVESIFVCFLESLALFEWAEDKLWDQIVERFELSIVWSLVLTWFEQLKSRQNINS